MPFFRRAVELDPNFALAHARLGTVLSNLGQRAEAEQAAARAYDLRDKVSERERLYIDARYRSTVTRDEGKAMESYRVLLATYPDDYAAHSNLGSLLREAGKLPEAIAHLEEAVRLAPGQPIGRSNLGSAYLADDRLADARREFEEVLKQQESGAARNGLFVIATLTGDQALANAQVEAVKGRREENELMGVRAQAAAFKGQMKEASRLTDELFRRAQAANRLGVAAEGFVGLALLQAAMGRADEARAQFARVQRHDMITDGTADEIVGLATVLSDAKLAEAYVERAVQHIRKVSVPESADAGERVVRAYAALAAKRDQEAYDLGVSAKNHPEEHNALLVAGIAALRLQHWDAAAAAFTTILGHRSKLGLAPLVGIAHVMLGRAHAGAGRTA